MLKRSGWTVTPWATRAVSVGSAKSYPPRVPGALPVRRVMVAGARQAFGVEFEHEHQWRQGEGVFDEHAFHGVEHKNL
ncbi:hypothetical protein [Desulfosarcina cetonica]|uniref:hypothetical protein n=1 Tax=Desulfosarcina cetonica TaxID=90730 RepID=UPI001FEF984E|nr:hypothetical protein [Desulfosarcina cetonica]